MAQRNDSHTAGRLCGEGRAAELSGKGFRLAGVWLGKALAPGEGLKPFLLEGAGIYSNSQPLALDGCSVAGPCSKPRPPANAQRWSRALEKLHGMNFLPCSSSLPGV